ncbi:MAG: hypothetical protein PHT80_00880 [Lentisphaeria bacterium]|nr:hypothetical protein [Lentisphaeria bacterium]
MINCAIRINDHAWQDWLEPVAATRRLCAIECDAGLFAAADFPAQLNKHGIRCLHARNILPGDTAAFLSESATEDNLLVLRRNLFGVMISAAATDTQVFSLQLRLDRIAPEQSAQHIECHARLLQPLLAAPLDTPYQLAIQVSQPRPYPQSHEWDYALAICRQAKSPRIGLAMNFYPDDFHGQGELKPLLNSCFDHLHVVCFHYNPLLGETLFDDEQIAWAEELKSRDFKGLVVFCPETDSRSNLSGVCEDALSWADFYS